MTRLIIISVAGFQLEPPHVGSYAMEDLRNRAVIALGGIPNKVQVGDMGVDDRAGNPR